MMDRIYRSEAEGVIAEREDLKRDGGERVLRSFRSQRT